ncbi:MAG: N-6 DNA methylase, partial [ANME-2 cluster archaeon]|nr:N-6 DNA methylase [ANME-2 cluster archaeon]
MMSKDEIKEEAKQNIKKLVERFRYNFDVYKKSAYNETQVRIEFIDPFFEAMGWDVGNKQDHAEQYKDVVHEDAIKIGGSTKAPDYSFRIGGQRKFFVEAKKPSVNVKDDVSPSYQLRRYAWSAKLPLSIVTDFEEFSVFDCRIKPNQTDKVSVGRIAYYTFEEYLDKFDEIYDIFSKEAIFKGSFDRHVQSTKGKRGTAEVDSEFLKEIESWRELLAKNIALRNPDVSIYELNYAVQKIIDRIIFLRICEDRGIEPYGQLQPAAESTDVYIRLLNHFKLAESKYNSGIFDFDYDKITPTLRIDDKVLKTIIGSLYYPISPYEFSVLGVEILGNVYEQFLGKVIRLTAGHQAKVETKPDVKKAGGVYYTPQYIVDYIVKNTVGKLVEGKTPEKIAEITILDPACGSGSFLIGAYSYLLQYHLDWYMENKPKKYKKAVFQVRENEWYLTTAEKKRILLNNIYGVDIDSQAVEVTKLSLQLKVLENE